MATFDLHNRRRRSSLSSPSSSSPSIIVNNIIIIIIIIIIIFIVIITLRQTLQYLHPQHRCLCRFTITYWHPLTILRNTMITIFIHHCHKNSYRHEHHGKLRTQTIRIVMMTSWNGNIFRVTGRGPVNSPHKGQWRGALMFSLICVWMNNWVNNREAGDLRRYRAIMTLL